MKLSDYLKLERGNAKRLAEKASVSPSTVGRIAAGEINPSRKTAEAISAATEGAVTAAEVYGFEAAA